MDRRAFLKGAAATLAAFPTAATAGDQHGTAVQIVVPSENIDIINWLVNRNNENIVHQHVFSYVERHGLGNGTSNLRRAMNSVPLDAIPGYEGKELGDYIADIEIRRNYAGNCNANGERGGTYVDEPKYGNVANLSFLAGNRGTIRGSGGRQNYYGTPGSEAQTAACDSQPLKYDR